jgi:hypothetical protein
VKTEDTSVRVNCEVRKLAVLHVCTCSIEWYVYDVNKSNHSVQIPSNKSHTHPTCDNIGPILNFVGYSKGR